MKNSFSHTNLVQKYFHNPHVPEGAVRVSLDAPSSAPQSTKAIFDNMTPGDNTIRHGMHEPGEIGKFLDVQKSEQVEQEAQVQNVINAINLNPNASDSDKQFAAGLQKAVDTHDAGVDRVVKDISGRVEFEKVIRRNLEFEWDNLSLKSLKGLIADIDGDGRVETVNNGWWNRVVRGQGEQKSIVGERQLYELIADKNQQEINAIYQRLTGNSDVLNFTKNDILGGSYNIGTAAGNYLNERSQNKIKQLQQVIAQKTDTLADIMQVIFSSQNKELKQKFGDVRAGVASVINGTESQFLSALSDPNNFKEFAQILADSPVIKEKPGLGSKILGTLMQLGISAPIAVMTGGSVNLKMQQTDYNAEDLGNMQGSTIGNVAEGWSQGTNGKVDRNIFNKQNMSATLSVGEKGSVGVDFNILSADLFANWNDPSTIMARSLETYRQAGNKREAYDTIIQKAMDGLHPSKRSEVQGFSNEFKKSQETILAQRDSFARSNPNDPRIREFDKALEDNVMIYTAKVIEARGMKLQGAYATFGLSGLAFGLSAARVNTHASLDGINQGAGLIESKINQREVTEAEINRTLQQIGIVNNNGTYMKDGQPVFSLKENEVVSWSVDQVVGMKEKYITATATIHNKVTKETKTIQLKIDNKDIRNTVIEGNSKAIADALLKARTSGTQSQKANMRSFQEAASRWDYEAAKASLAQVFSKDQKMLQHINNATNEDINGAMDLFLEKTSGGSRSRGIADKFNAANNSADYTKARNELLKYYDDQVGAAFSQRYGIPKGDIRTLVENMTANQKGVSNISNHTPNGFNAVVAYSQGHGFRRLDHVVHGNARIFGEPQLVTGTNAEKAREHIKNNLSESMIKQMENSLITAYGNNLPDNLKNPTALREEAKRQLTAGNIKSYLSYVEDAECFNLGFFVEPGSIEITYDQGKVVQHKLGTGSVVGLEDAQKSEVGLAIGIDLKKNETPKEDTPSTEPTPGETPVPNKPPVTDIPDNPPPGTPITPVDHVSTTIHSGAPVKVSPDALAEASANAVSSATQVVTQNVTQSTGDTVSKLTSLDDLFS